MTDIPDAAELLDTARETLLAELVPGMSKEARYTALMVANAMAIAMREARQGADVARREAAALGALLADVDADVRADAAVPELREAMRRAIRAGAFDDASHAARITPALLRIAAGWVGVSNPKALRDPSNDAGTSADGT